MSSGWINESGISVSVPSSPRASVDNIEEIEPGAPLKKRYEEAHEEAHEEEESVSPRVLFPSSVARRLEFYSSGEWSPIPLPSSPSVASPSVASEFIALLEATQPIIVVPEDTVGECNVCYMALPPRSNHVFTPCGHLFCVKCMLLWWDTSTTCAMCRGEILDITDGGVAAAAAAAASDSESDSESDSDAESDADADADADAHADSGSDADAHEEEGDYAPNFQYFLADAIADRRHSDDDNIGGRDVSPPRPIPAIDQYLHTDSGVEWESLHGGTTNPAGDDWGIQLTRHECINIRLNRKLASMLWARRRFNETLFSNIDFLGETFHTFIPKTNWLWFGMRDMGPHRMFEFVMCRTNVHNRGHETNFFGYISQAVVVDADHPVTSTSSYDGFADWENTHEYAFVAHVFSPNTAPYDNTYNIDEGTFVATELIFRFADIRRLYSIQSTERGAA